jgi:hypothetical protein
MESRSSGDESLRSYDAGKKDFRRISSSDDERPAFLEEDNEEPPVVHFMVDKQTKIIGDNCIENKFTARHYTNLREIEYTIRHVGFVMGGLPNDSCSTNATSSRVRIERGKTHPQTTASEKMLRFIATSPPSGEIQRAQNHILRPIPVDGYVSSTSEDASDDVEKMDHVAIRRNGGRLSPRRGETSSMVMMKPPPPQLEGRRRPSRQTQPCSSS